MTREEFISSVDLPKPQMPTNVISDLVQTLDMAKPRNKSGIVSYLEDYIESLKDKGYDYIDAYHVTDMDITTLPEEDIIGSSLSYIGETTGSNLREPSVYLFLDPDDIFRGTRVLEGQPICSQTSIILKYQLLKLKICIGIVTLMLLLTHTAP